MALSDHAKGLDRQVSERIAQVNDEAVYFASSVLQQIDGLMGLQYSPQQLMLLAQQDPQQALQIQTQQQALNVWKQQLQQQAQGMHARSQAERSNASEVDQQAQQQQIAQTANELRSEKWFTQDWVKQAFSFGEKHGFSQEDINNIGHKGALQIMRKAMLWDDAQSRMAAGKQQPQTKNTTPGSNPKQGVASQRQLADKAFNVAVKTGDKRATAMAYDQLLKTKR
ncbi:MAG: hypothetical protein ACRCV9_13855 [Burkholderiaceae bacterium]